MLTPKKRGDDDTSPRHVREAGGGSAHSARANPWTAEISQIENIIEMHAADNKGAMLDFEKQGGLLHDAMIETAGKLRNGGDLSESLETIRASRISLSCRRKDGGRGGDSAPSLAPDLGCAIYESVLFASNQSVNEDSVAVGTVMKLLFKQQQTTQVTHIVQ